MHPRPAELRCGPNVAVHESLRRRRAALKRGVDPSDQQFSEIREDATKAEKEIEEAANSHDGLFDLPLLDSEKTSGISKGGPRVYSEASPYVFMDVQRDAGRGEDDSRRGT